MATNRHNALLGSSWLTNWVMAEQLWNSESVNLNNNSSFGLPGISTKPGHTSQLTESTDCNYMNTGMPNLQWKNSLNERNFFCKQKLHNPHKYNTCEPWFGTKTFKINKILKTETTFAVKTCLKVSQQLQYVQSGGGPCWAQQSSSMALLH